MTVYFLTIRANSVISSNGKGRGRKIGPRSRRRRSRPMRPSRLPRTERKILRLRGNTGCSGTKRRNCLRGNPDGEGSRRISPICRLRRRRTLPERMLPPRRCRQPEKICLRSAVSLPRWGVHGGSSENGCPASSRRCTPFRCRIISPRRTAYKRRVWFRILKRSSGNRTNWARSSGNMRRCAPISVRWMWTPRREGKTSRRRRICTRFARRNTSCLT